MELKSFWIQNKYTLNYVVNGRERGYIITSILPYSWSQHQIYAFCWSANAIPCDRAQYEGTFCDIQKAQAWVEDKIAKLDSADNFN